jgi:hypothetical protein
MEPQGIPPAPTAEWAHDILGRNWEVFWKPQSEYENDWYDAIVQTYVGTSSTTGCHIFAVSFVGEDDVHEMELSPNLVRPRNTVTTPAPTDEHSPAALDWAKSLAGCECEIFWKQLIDDSLPPKRDFDEEADWYDARIEQLLNQDTYLFQLTFTGDDNVYEMPLRPAIVRPSARAWVRRTLAILQLEGSFEEWERELSNSDTKTLNDAAALNEIGNRIRTLDFRVVSQLTAQQERKYPFSQNQEQVFRLVEAIRTQIYLRTRLAPIEKERTTDADNPAESYVNYLVQCLRDLERCCKWYKECYQLFATLMGCSDVKLNRDVILQDALYGARQTMSILVSMDASVAGCKRKRRANATALPVHSSPQTSRQQRKRIKTIKGLSEFWREDELGERILNPELSTSDFFFTDVVQRFVEKLITSDDRWYTAVFSTILKTLSCQAVAPLVKWERRAEFYLGDKDFLDVEASDGETSEEDMDEGEESVGYHSKDQRDDTPSQPFVSFEEIQCLVDSAGKGVLGKVDLAGTVERLHAKLCNASSFEDRAWKLVRLVLEEASTPRKEIDEICILLIELLSEAKRVDSPLRNIEPFGRGLSRKVVENAIVYREWFLDLVYAEAVRERVSFLESVVTRLSRLPPLSSRTDCQYALSIAHTISQRLDLIVPRVQSLSKKYIDQVSLFNHFTSMLGDRLIPQSSMEGSLLEEKVRDALSSLKRVGAISISEEMLAVRLDVLMWENRAIDVFSREKPVFEELRHLHELLVSILEGQSRTRVDLTRHTRPNTEVDEEVRVFARADIQSMCEPLIVRTKALFKSSSEWKQRADAILGALQLFGNESAGEAAPNQRSPGMVDIKRIQDLVQEYDVLDVDIVDIHARLRRIHGETSQWASSVSECLTNPNVSCDDHLTALRFFKPTRPKGIIVNPTRQVLDLVEELCTWHSEVCKVARSSEVDGDYVISLLIQGIDIVRMYSECDPRMFSVPEDASEFLSSLLSVKRPIRAIARSKLEASQLSGTFLAHIAMTDSYQEKECPALFAMLFYLWQLYVNSFVHQSVLRTTPESERSLVRAKELLRSKPELKSSVFRPPLVDYSCLRVVELKKSVEEGERNESAARVLFSESKNLLRAFAGKHDTVREHHARLKELLSIFKAQSLGGVVLDKSIEQLLEREARVYSWLVSLQRAKRGDRTG